MSIIVVEGVDGSGKSTLLENARSQITRRYFAMVRHSCRPLTISQGAEFVHWIGASRFLLEVIVDRHPLISEPIYGPILRGGCLFATHDWDEDKINHHLLKIDRVIYCRPSLDTILKNIEVQPQLAGVRDKLVPLLVAYDVAMTRVKNLGVPVYAYDYETDTHPLEELFFGDWREGNQL